MAGMVRVDIEAVRRHIGAACARNPRVAAAYLFGSALGEMRPDSDIDVGVVLSAQGRALTGLAAFGLSGQLEGALGFWDRHPFEVTVFSVDNAIFVMSALRDAVLAYEGDGEVLADFLEAVAQRYRVDGPRYWDAVREVNGWDAHPTPNA